MKLLRVVFDTNVIVSAALASQKDLVAQGRPSLCLQLALNGLVDLALSPELFSEYEAVLMRPKFDFPRAAVRTLLAEIRASATLVEHVEGLSSELVSDSHDLPILATAVAAAADYLVTGNIKHFPSTYRGVSVVTPRAFLEAWFRRQP